MLSGVEDLQPGGYDGEFYLTQYELLKSRSLAERVVASLNLKENLPTFSRDQRLLSRFSSRVSEGTSERGNTLDAATQQRAAEDFVIEGLSVDPIMPSRLVEISFKSPDPALSQQIANAVADSFIAANLEHRFDASAYARKFLEDRLQQLKVKLEESDKALVAYAQQQQIVSVGDKQTTVAADLEAANTKLADVRNTRIRNEQLWMQAKSTAGLGLSQILESPIVQKLRDVQAGLRAEYQQKLNLFKPAYPEMVDLQARIHELDMQVQAEVGNIKNSIKADYEASLSEETAVETQVAGLKDQILNLKARSIQYNILERETDTNRQLYDGLLQRYKEIGVAGGVGTNNVSVVDRAQMPLFRSSPNLKMNLALSLVFGLAAGMMCAFGRESLDDTLKSKEEIETSLGLPVLGVIPTFSGGGEVGPFLSDPQSALSEAYQWLCTTLHFSTEHGLPRTILITSTRPHEGKTTTALALARNLARLGRRVLLVDTDLRNPSLHRAIGCSNKIGLGDYLAGTARPSELLVRTDFPNLTFIPSGPPPPDPTDLLASTKLCGLLSVAEEVCDAVIIDGPPVMGMSDSALLSNFVAGTLIVIAAGKVPRAEVEEALKRLELVRANVLGVLLTKFNARSASYYYRRFPFYQGTPYGRSATSLLIGQSKAVNKVTAAA